MKYILNQENKNVNRYYVNLHVLNKMYKWIWKLNFDKSYHYSLSF
jgi:hypothetical protein